MAGVLGAAHDLSIDVLDFEASLSTVDWIN